MIRFARHIFRLLCLCVVVLTMVGSLSSCRRYAGDETAVDSALSVADSLRYDSPEAADSIIRSLDADSLGSRANAALYALLANEVNLYGDQVAVADSLADIATDYYRMRSWLSDDAGRLYARALMQKPIQQSVDDENADAISTHKLASELIDTTNRADFNLVADAQFNLATLYAKAFSPKKESLDIFKRANHYYMLADNKRRSANCLCLIGAYYRGVDMDSAYKYMNASLHLSRQIGDSAMVFRNLAHIERAYYMQGRYEECKQRCLYILRQGPNHVVKNEVLFDLSKAYARLGILDSAEYYKSQMTLDIDSPRDRYKMYSVNEVLSLSRGDNLAAYHYLDSASKLSAKVTSDGKLMQMHKIREKYDYTKIELKNRQLQNWVLGFLVVISLGVIVAGWSIWRMRKKRYETELFILELRRSLTDYEANISQYIKVNNELSSQVESLRQVDNDGNRDSCGNAETDRLLNYLGVYISKTMHACNYACEISEQNSSKFVSQFRKELEQISLHQEFLPILKHYINAQYDNLLVEIESAYGITDDKKLSIIALGIIGFSREMICSILSITSKGTLATAISRMNRLELNGVTLKDFISNRVGRAF